MTKTIRVKARPWVTSRHEVRQQIRFVEYFALYGGMWKLFCRAGHYPGVHNLLYIIRRKNPPCNAEDNMRAGLVVIEAWFRGY